MQPLQQAKLNLINSFDGVKKAEFTTSVQSVENASGFCSLDTVDITLSKLQGAPLKSTMHLEGKETSAGKKHSWNKLQQHLTDIYSEIPYEEKWRSITFNLLRADET